MRIERKNGVIRIIDPPGYIVLASDAEAKELAVELYKMSDGGDGSVTVTGRAKTKPVIQNFPIQCNHEYSYAVHPAGKCIKCGSYD